MADQDLGLYKKNFTTMYNRLVHVSTCVYMLLILGGGGYGRALLIGRLGG